MFLPELRLGNDDACLLVEADNGPQLGDEMVRTADDDFAAGRLDRCQAIDQLTGRNEVESSDPGEIEDRLGHSLDNLRQVFEAAGFQLAGEKMCIFSWPADYGRGLGGNSLQGLPGRRRLFEGNRVVDGTLLEALLRTMPLQQSQQQTHV